MQNILTAYQYLFVSAIMILGILIVFGIIRAIKGPRVADRIVAINMVGTLVIIIVAILSVMLGESYLVDICLIYAMVSFLAVVVLTKVYMGAHAEAKRLKEKAAKEEE